MTEATIDVYDFQEMRPYNDAELQAAIERMVQEPLLIKMMKWVYPGLRKTEILNMFREVSSVQQFQEEISAPAVKVITQMTTSGVSFSERIRNRARQGVSVHFQSPRYYSRQCVAQCKSH